jgi:outer membrane protein OmpA-like peptidoglycan-associated protein
MEYNLHREQCQHYQDPPAGYVLKGCDVYRAGSAPVADIQPRAGEPEAVAPAPAPAPEPVRAPEASNETIYFDWDKSNIRESERTKFDSLINAIKGDNPDHVTVSGYADRSGDVDYNQALSERRAQTVTDEMTANGIRKEVIEQEAYGETHLAVPTEDGVRMQENRRAVIEYNH